MAFYFAITSAGGQDGDRFSARIDGVPLFEVTDANVVDYPTYTRIHVDVSAFADGEVHELSFEAAYEHGVFGIAYAYAVEYVFYLGVALFASVGKEVR